MSIVPAYANPVGEQVVAGAATFQRVGNSLTIQQGTDRAVINWNQFSIAAGETTKFVMPNASSAALNRVLSGNPSAIYGNLQANGHLFLINPAGILVGPGGTVNAASFIASTRDVSNEAFLHGGDLGFLGDSAASILNQGKIEAATGDVFLIAQHVENEGQLIARDGTVGMVSGTQVILQSVGPQNFKVRLAEVSDESKVQKGKDGVAEVVNEGVIEAANAALEATGNVGSLAINNAGTIRATGVKPNVDGSVTLTGGEGDVLNSGVIAALRKNVEGKEVGGEVRIAGRNITTEESSLTTAAGSAGGGNIRMRATDTTLISGRIEATGYADQAKGGRVELLGKNVGLRSGEVNVDGGAKGGTVLVGGDYLGLNPEIPNAQATVITPDARISANARVNGDGGKVIVWSDEYTGFFGGITALGGPEGGNGGFIETSSKNNLQAFGEAQASAPKGISGEWLLDPYNVTITSQAPSTGGGFDGKNPDLFTPKSNDAKVFAGDINRALDAGTSVTITTGSSGAQAGNIVVAANITKSRDTPPAAPDVVLRLQAANDLVINGGITIQSVAGSLGIELLADFDNSGAGKIDLRDNVTLSSNAGDIVLQSAAGLSIGSDVLIDATMALATAESVYGGQRFSGDVTIRPSAPSTPISVGVGGGVGGLQITQSYVNSVVLLDPTQVTTARAGTLILGARSGGLLTLGTLSGPLGLNYNIALVSGSAGLAQTSGASGLDVGEATAILDTAGRIGRTDNPFLLSAKRLGIFTEGPSFDIISSQILDRLYVQTAGTTGDGAFVTALNQFNQQNLWDNGATSYGDSNLKYDVSELSGNTLIGASTTKGTGFTVNTGSIDFTYANTSTLPGAGNIRVGTAGTMANPASSGVTFSGGRTGIPFGIMTVQDPNGPSGVWAGLLGRVSLSMNGTLFLDSAQVTYTSTYNPTGLGTPTTIIQTGGIFSGGGDIFVRAKDIDFQNTRGNLILTAPQYGNASNYFVLWGPQYGAALNSFQPALNSTFPTASFYDFGLRQTFAYGSTFGQLSGASGTISIGAAPSSTGPTPIIFTDPQTNVVQGQMNISVYETWAMEGRSVQIGSAETGDIVLGTLPTINNLEYTYYNGIVTIVVGGVSYTPRYFEAPFAGTIDGVFSPPFNPRESYAPPPHVQDIKVSLVSGAGSVQMDATGDVNVSGFSVTAISGISLQGFRRNDNYAPVIETAYDFTSKDGSQFDFFSARVGRTYLDNQSSSGSALLAHFSQDGLMISDSTEVMTGRALMQPALAGTLGVAGIQVDPQYTSPSGTRFYNFSAEYPADLQVIIGAPDLASGVQATGTFALDSEGKPTVVINNPGSGYLKPPAILILAPKQAGTGTLAGFQQAGAVVQMNGSGIFQITPVLDAATGQVFGGSGYQAAPDVSIVGGGIELGSARAVLDEYGRIGVVAPIAAGLGYTSAPTVSVSGGGGAGAVIQAVINDRGQLTPFNVINGGSNYRSTPTIVIEDPTGQGCGAIARPIMSNQSNGVLVGIMPVVGGSGYTPGSTLIIRILGGDPDIAATASVVVPQGGSLSSFIITNPGSGYTSEPTISLSGGGIRPAQARAVVDLDPLSGNYGKVVAYALADPGLGYKSTPLVVVGAGGATGQFGEVGVRTDNVDLAVGSGSITLRAYRDLGTDLANNQLRPVTSLAPVATGDSGTGEGSAAVSGSILVQATGQVSANYRGMFITGDVSPGAGGSEEITFSGDISVLGQRILAQGSILSLSYGASDGFPVQIGSTPGFGSPGIFSFTGNGAFRTQSKEEGAAYIFAPAPYQLDGLYGKALNPNLPAPAVLKVSNDLTVGGISTRANFENPVRVDVGSPEGLLKFRSTVVAGGEPFVNGGQVTFIEKIADQRVYATAPTVEVRGGGVARATARATVEEGRITSITPVDGGDGYALQPSVTIQGGGGIGARANAVVDFDPASPTYKKVVTIEIIDPGFGYTSNPEIVIGNPTGANVSQTSVLITRGGLGEIIDVILVGDGLASGRQSVLEPRNPLYQVDPDGVGLGYFAAPNVLIFDSAGQGRGAVVTAEVNAYGQVTKINIVERGIGYISPTIQIGPPVTVATATANLDASGQIESFTVTNSGGGYTSTPQVLARTGSNDPYNLDLDHAGFFSDRFDFGSLGIQLITADVVGLGPFTNQRPVDLGTVTPGSTSFVAEDVLRFQANGLVIGTRKYNDSAYGAGIITVSQAVNAQSFLVDALALAGTRQVRDLGGTTGLQFSSVVIDAGAQVTLTGGGNRIKNFAGVIRDTGLAEGASFTIASRLDSVDLGGAWLSPLPLNLNEVLIDAPEFTGQRFYQGIETQDGDINVFADDLELSSINGYLDTTGGDKYSVTTSTVTLAPFSTGGSVPIQIYYSSPPSATGSAGATSIQMQTFGSGYTSVPTVELSDGTRTVAATPNMVLNEISIPSIPTGTFTSIPTVEISGGGGSGATAEAIVDFRSTSPSYGKVIGFRITSQGSGYTSQPKITLSGGGSSQSFTTTGTLAVQYATLSGSAGLVFSSTPTVTFSGGGATTQATATALGGFLNLIIGNPARPELELVRASSVRIGGNTSLPIEIGSPNGCDDPMTLTASSAGISLNTVFGYDYALLRYAPRTLVLATQQGITFNNSQIPPGTSSSAIQMPNLSVISQNSVTISSAAAGAVNFLSALITGAGNSFTFNAGSGVSGLTVADLRPLGGVAGITTPAGGSISLTAPNLVIPLMSPGATATAYNLPSTLTSGANISLTANLPGGRISVAVVPQFDTAAWNTPGGGGTVNSTIVASQPNAVVTLTADRIELGDDAGNTPPGYLTPPLIAANAASGRVILQPFSSGTSIILGGAKGADFNFTGTELANIQANILQIGNSASGPILVDAVIDLKNPPYDPARLPGALVLISGSSIQDNGPATGIQYGGGLRLAANGAISFLSSQNEFGTVTANSNGNPITLTSSAFSIATPGNLVDGLNGVTATGNRVSLLPSSSVPINLGTKTGWSFTDAELSQVYADTLQIGRNDAGLASGDITISAVIHPENINTLSLWTGGGISSSPAGTSGVVVANLALRAGGAVNMGGALNVTTGNTDTVNLVSGLAAEVTGPGSLSFANGQTLTIGQVDGLAGIVTAGNAGDDVTLSADDMQIQQAISVGNGSISLQPLSRATGMVLGDVTNSLNLTQNEMRLLTSTATVTIGRANGTGSITVGTLDLGTPGQGYNYDLVLQGAESDVTFVGQMTLADDRSLALRVGTGTVTSNLTPAGLPAVIIGGVNGRLIIGTSTVIGAGSLGSVNQPLLTSLAFLDGANVGGAVYLRNLNNLTVSGVVSAQGPIYLSSSTGLFQNTAAISSTISIGTVTLEGDTMDLLAAVTGPGGINLQPFTADTSVGVFGGLGTFSISNAEFDLLLGTSPVTIGNPLGTGNVEVNGRNPIGRSLTIQSPEMPNSVPGPQGTFTLNGDLDTARSGANLTLNAGGGIFTANGNISAGDAATRNGTVSIIAQTINIDPTALVTGNGPGGGVPGISLANGAGGDVYLNTGGAGPTDLSVGAATLQRLRSTGPISFGRLTNPDGSDSAAWVYVGDITVGSAQFNFGGLNLLAGNSGRVQLMGNILSQSKPVYIDGPLVLPGTRAITMNDGGGTGASLSILNGIRGESSPFDQDLILTMGTGANTLTLAGGETADRMGTLTIDLGGASIVLGSSTLDRGLNLGFRKSFTLPANATLQGGPINLLVEGTGNSLITQNLSGAQPLRLTTTGANGAITTGALDVQSLDVSAGPGGVVTLQSVTAATGVTLAADTFVLNGKVTATSGNVSLTKTTLSSPLVLGNGGDLDAAGLLLLQAPAGEVILGRGTTGGLRLQGPIDLSSSGTLRYALEGASGGVAFSGGSPVLSLPDGGRLRLDLGTGSVSSSGGTDLSIPDGELIIDRAGQVTIRTAISTVRQTPGLANLAGLNLVNAGSLTLAGAFHTGTGNILVRTLSGNLTLGGTMTGGTIQLGAAQNFINLAGPNPFTNLGGGRTLIYSAGQRYDSPYNFAGLNGFGVAFGRGFGSMPGSGNFLVYSQYAQTGLDDGVVYYEMFSGNSVSALLALSPSLFWSVNGQMIPKTRPGGYIDYMLYPQRVEPATMTLPQPVLSRLEQKLGRPPTVAEIAADEADRRRNRMMRTGGLVERNSFDAEIEPQVEAKKQIRADRADAEPTVPTIPQAQAMPMPEIPTARAVVPGEVAPQAGKSRDQNQEVKGPALRRGVNRAIALRAEPVDASKIVAEEREKAEVNLAAPVAGH